MNLALCFGIHQAFFGTSFSLASGKILDLGREDYLSMGSNTEPVNVRTVGVPDFKDTLDSFARVKISFSF
jgi:hypothetical protein